MIAVLASVLAEPTPGATETETHNPIFPIMEEIVLGTIAFGVLCFVLMKFVFPRMEAMYQSRVDAIEGGIRRAEERQAEANAVFEQYRAQLADARSEAARIRQDATADAEAIKAEVLAKAREESDRIIAAGREQLTAERATIVRELRGDIGSLAVQLAERIVGESLEEETRRRGTVDRFLADLDGAGLDGAGLDGAGLDGAGLDGAGAAGGRA